ncbi:FUSC family protein [Campylobacter geochelonis]|uniref:FUSC family protein n=1 Tax=Campylobacter geochelonis TaxID=1780362 RepID=UPI00077070CA|nr:FUSC family protein [Campylobacter geochelonis]CZE50941.1 integral membrane protein [Campylobacter geochelonis]
MLKELFSQLFYFNKTDRIWQLPFACAICVGAPLLVSAYFDKLNYGIVASLGGLVFLYIPKTKIHHRMVILMACSFGMATSFTLGALSHFSPTLIGLVLGMIASLGAMVCRFYQLNTPGNFFFIMLATLGAYMPFEIANLPYLSGLVLIGTMFACVIAFIYSIATFQKTAIETPKEHTYLGFEEVIVDPVIIGIFVGLSVFVAGLIGLEKPYWVPITCVAIMQGMTMRSTWIRQLHRVVGTAVGVGLSWVLLSFSLNEWSIAVLIMLFSFLSEYFVVRNYGFAMLFITPMTILMAESSGVISADSSTLIVLTRLEDIVLGSLIGVLGGLFLHTPNLRNLVSKSLKFLYFFKNAR